MRFTRSSLAILTLLLICSISAQAASPRPAWAKHAMVSTADSLATEIGLDVLERGGNAVIDRPLVLGDILSLPFRDNAFGYIITRHILEHVDEPPPADPRFHRHQPRMVGDDLSDDRGLPSVRMRLHSFEHAWRVKPCLGVKLARLKSGVNLEDKSERNVQMERRRGRE